MHKKTRATRNAAKTLDYFLIGQNTTRRQEDENIEKTKWCQFYIIL